MNNIPIYLFDSDILIAAKNLYYNPNFAKIFWDWFQHGVDQGIFRTVKTVKTEFLKGKKSQQEENQNNPEDFLVELAQNGDFEDFWLDIKIEGMLSAYQQVVSWVQNDWCNSHKQKDNDSLEIIRKAKDTFLEFEKADPWLITYALHLKNNGKNVYLLTNETSAKRKINNIKIPDVAEGFDIKIIKLWDVLSKHSSENFTFKSPAST